MRMLRHPNLALKFGLALFVIVVAALVIVIRTGPWERDAPDGKIGASSLSGDER